MAPELPNNLFEIVACNSIVDAKRLLDAGCDINERLSSGDTVMHLAASFASVEMIEFLIRRGASLFSLNHENQTPISISHLNPNKDVQQLFRNLMIFINNMIEYKLYLRTFGEKDAFFTLCVELDCESLFNYGDICIDFFNNQNKFY